MPGLSCFNKIQPLTSLCCLKVTYNHLIYQEEFYELPIQSKKRILEVLCKSGKCDHKSLKYLGNEFISRVDLSFCDVTDELLLQLPVCVNLTDLILASVRGYRYDVQNSGLIAVFKVLKHLQNVQLKRCANVGDKSIVSLAEQSNDMKILNLCGCSEISDESIEALACHCPNLKALTVERTNITDKGLLALANAKCASKLEEVLLDGCPKITDKSINTLEANCSNLKILTYFNCRLTSGGLFS